MHRNLSSTQAAKHRSLSSMQAAKHPAGMVVHIPVAFETAYSFLCMLRMPKNCLRVDGLIQYICLHGLHRPCTDSRSAAFKANGQFRVCPGVIRIEPRRHDIRAVIDINLQDGGVCKDTQCMDISGPAFPDRSTASGFFGELQ